MQVFVAVEINPHQLAVGVVGVTHDAICRNLILARLAGCLPNILQRAPVVLHIFVGVFAIGVKDDLPDALPAAAQVINRLCDDFHCVGLSHPRHAKDGGFLRQQIGGMDIYRYIIHPLPLAVSGCISHHPKRHRNSVRHVNPVIDARIVHDFFEGVANRLVDFQSTVGVVVGNIAAETQYNFPRAVLVRLQKESPQNPATHPRIPQQHASVRVHCRIAVPVLTGFATDLTRGFNAHTFRLPTVRQFRRVHHSQQNGGRILFNRIDRGVGRVHSAGKQKTQRGNAAYLPPLVVVNLNARRFVSDGKNLAHILRLLEEFAKESARFFFQRLPANGAGHSAI